MTERPARCTLCEIREQSPEELRAIVDSYIASLPAESKADDALYEQRLSRCRDCSHLHAGMCGVCGCFVQVRAIKAAMHCPKPYSRW